jgi:hypothetical protein
MQNAYLPGIIPPLLMEATFTLSVAADAVDVIAISEMKTHAPSANPIEIFLIMLFPPIVLFVDLLFDPGVPKSSLHSAKDSGFPGRPKARNDVDRMTVIWPPASDGCWRFASNVVNASGLPDNGTVPAVASWRAPG